MLARFAERRLRLLRVLGGGLLDCVQGRLQGEVHAQQLHVVLPAAGKGATG